MIQQSHSLIITQMSWKHMSTQNLHINVCNSFIHNCQNLEVIKMFFSRWLVKSIVVHLDNGLLFSIKKKWAIKPWKDMEEI